MAGTETLASSSSREQFLLVDLKLPTLTDQHLKIQVQELHKHHYAPVLRQPHLSSISRILKPATDFVDSILLANKVPENEIELLASNILEFDSTFSELMALGDHDCYGMLTLFMDRTANKAMQSFEEIDLHNESLYPILTLGYLSWDTKTIVLMGWFVFKFLEFLGFLLHGPNQPLIQLAYSVAALKENHLTSQLEKFQSPLNQLNSLIKITWEVIQYISELSLLSDTEYIANDIFSTSAYWALVSVVACHIQITLLMQNNKVAVELSHLISTLSDILNNLKDQYTTCKLNIEEMEVIMQSNASFEDILKTYETHIEVSELVKRFIYSKDGRQSLIDGSTMSEIDIELLKGKGILFFISDLDISTKKIAYVLEFYKKISKEDYYKIVWVPFVLKWTEELRKKFQNLKSKMPWYIVNFDSPVAGLWYIKGRWFSSHNPSFALVDPEHGNEYVIYPPIEKKNKIYVSLKIVEEKRFPFKRLKIHVGEDDPNCINSATPMLPQLYSIHTSGAQQTNPSSGFAGLLSKSKTTGNK